MANRRTFTPGSNEMEGAKRGSNAYQVMKKPATGTGRDAINAGPKGDGSQQRVNKQGSRGRAPIMFGHPARGMVKGYVKTR